MNLCMNNKVHHSILAFTRLSTILILWLICRLFVLESEIFSYQKVFEEVKPMGRYMG
jgi:hypothetical protein